MLLLLRFHPRVRGLIELLPRYSREDIKGAKFGEELERIGFKGEVPVSYESNKLSAHFEVHIEQGPILEKEDKPVAVVQGVQGTHRLKQQGIAGLKEGRRSGQLVHRRAPRA